MHLYRRLPENAYLPCDIKVPLLWEMQVSLSLAWGTEEGVKSRAQWTGSGTCRCPVPAPMSDVWLCHGVPQHWRHLAGLSPHTVIIQGIYWDLLHIPVEPQNVNLVCHLEKQTPGMLSWLKLLAILVYLF